MLRHPLLGFGNQEGRNSKQNGTFVPSSGRYLVECWRDVAFVKECVKTRSTWTPTTMTACNTTFRVESTRSCAELFTHQGVSIESHTSVQEAVGKLFWHCRRDDIFKHAQVSYRKRESKFCPSKRKNITNADGRFCQHKTISPNANFIVTISIHHGDFNTWESQL